MTIKGPAERRILVAPTHFNGRMTDTKLRASNGGRGVHQAASFPRVQGCEEAVFQAVEGAVGHEQRDVARAGVGDHPLEDFVV